MRIWRALLAAALVVGAFPFLLFRQSLATLSAAAIIIVVVRHDLKELESFDFASLEQKWSVSHTPELSLVLNSHFP